jgi:hypothetical protein
MELQLGEQRVILILLPPLLSKVEEHLLLLVVVTLEMGAGMAVQALLAKAAVAQGAMQERVELQTQ